MDCTRLTCPECKSVLRPTKPVAFGKQVKCPKCSNLFFAPGLEENEEELPRKKKASAKKSKAGIKKAASPKPPPKKPVHDDDEEEGGGIYSFAGANEVKRAADEEDDRPQIEYAPDMSIKDLRGPAQEAVVKPTNLMVLIGGLCFLSNIFLFCLQFWPMVFSDSVVNWQDELYYYYKAKDDKNSIQRIQAFKEYSELKDKDLEIIQEAEDKSIYGFPFGRISLMGGLAFLLIYNAIAIIGAVKMQNLESRRWGIAASIMMLLPMGSGGLGGLFYTALMFLEKMTGLLGELTQYYGIGLAVVVYLASIYVAVMSLRALFSQAVIDGFEYVAD